jgi:arylsulfatase A-like enzyme
VSGTRPNVVWICTDQHHHAALSAAGHGTVETPNIDRLAARGVQFADTYCPSPVCGPSRGSLFTGLYPQNSGVTGNQEPFADGVRTLPELLSGSGYRTGLVGKLHFTPTAASHGFDHERKHDAMYDIYDLEEPWNSDYVAWLAEKRFDGDVSALVERANEDERTFWESDMHRFLLGSNWRSVEEHSNTWVTDESVEYLRGAEEPFFLFTSYFGPHQPMLAPGEYADAYDPDDVTLPPEFDVGTGDKPIAARNAGGHFDQYAWTEEQYREVLAAYYGQITMIDDGIGRILDALDEQGLREETVVIFTADHGDHAGQFGWFFKGTMYEGAARVPLVVADPTAGGPSGRTSERVVNNLDLFETVLERAGVDCGYDTASRSLCGLLDDPATAEWSDVAYAELGNERMLADDEYKLIRREEDGDELYELYDRGERPYDAENRWGRPGYREKQRELVERLDAHAASLADNGPA